MRPPTPADPWWDEVAASHAQTPIGDLIDGWDAIADQPIPYSELPRRASTNFAADFARWSDLVAETPHTLLHRPKTGAGTVKALLAAARDAVDRHRAAETAEAVGPAEAADALLNRFDDRDRAVLATRIWASRKPSRPQLAKQLGVHLSWVERNEPKIQARFDHLVGDPSHRVVADHAAELRQRLGVYLPDSALDAELRALGLEPGGDAAAMLLHLAGPYDPDGDWWENSRSGGRPRIDAAARKAFEVSATPTHKALTRALTAAGMTPAHVDPFLTGQSTLRRFGDVWVRWGGTAADKAEAVLTARRTPLPVEVIHESVGDGLALRTVREALSLDDRFMRTGRRTWALRRWGLDEYGGLVDEMTARIRAAGGAIHVDALVDDVRSAFPDVAEGSVRTFLNTLAFVVEDGRVRLRTDIDAWPPIGPLRSARGAFRNGDNGIRLTIPVTSELLRGSGRPVPAAVATAVGVEPAKSRRFANPHGDVTLTWRLSSTSGPNASSLRAHALAVEAVPGDTLLLTFETRAATVVAARLAADASPHDHLAQILGHDATDLRIALAAALDCPPAEVQAVLAARGDHFLADALE